MPSLKDQFCDLPQSPQRAKYVGRQGKKASEKKLSGVKTGVKQLKKAKTSPPSVKKSTEVKITKLTSAEKQRPNLRKPFPQTGKGPVKRNTTRPSQ